MERVMLVIRDMERGGDVRHEHEAEDEGHGSSEHVLIEIRDLIRELRAEIGGLREEVHMIRERLDHLLRD